MAFVGDAHLLASDPETTAAFIRFLESAPGRFARLVLVGDIFDLWLARPHLHEAHHVAVLAAIERARATGLSVDYVVGNRDFGVEGLRPGAFTQVAEIRLPATAAGVPSWHAEHGDLVNAADTSYRRWRRIARSWWVLGTFLALPAWLAVPASRWIERRLRTTNLAYKRRVPVELIAGHAAELFRTEGGSLLVLGHFHSELRIDAPPGIALVLPDWKRSRRHAEWWPAGGPGNGTARFADSLT